MFMLKSLISLRPSTDIKFLQRAMAEVLSFFTLANPVGAQAKV
jgi:hypothetical protein